MHGPRMASNAWLFHDSWIMMMIIITIMIMIIVITIIIIIIIIYCVFNLF